MKNPTKTAMSILRLSHQITRVGHRALVMLARLEPIASTIWAAFEALSAHTIPKMRILQCNQCNGVCSPNYTLTQVRSVEAAS
jgi:hypothetical protein